MKVVKVVLAVVAGIAIAAVVTYGRACTHTENAYWLRY